MSRARDARERVRGYFVIAGVISLVLLGAAAPAMAQRVLGIDISAWQGNLSQTTWNNLRNVDNRQFVFIRSSRGGTTGYYNQSDPNNLNGDNTLSQRYDDPYFIQNITRATNAGMLAGAYHFSRPDIIETTLNSNGIPNNGTDEANHFIEMAGPWMRPGYLLPVHDLEAGQSQRTSSQLSTFAIDFSNRISAAMGIRPIIYVSQSYANYVNSTVPPIYPNLWIARWPQGSGNPFTGDIQNDNPPPSPSTANVYGKWNPNFTVANPYPDGHPWKFWQYSSGEILQSYGSRLDGDVANGGIEFVKDHLVPAVWMNDSSGEWTTLLNWNSGQTPIEPVQGPGQVARVGSMTLPTPRLPGTDDTLRNVSGANDTVILDRPSANITVTHSSGTHNIRKLIVRETLNITGGSLTVNYDPATWISPLKPNWFIQPSDDTINVSAQFSGAVTLSGSGALSVHTLRVDSTRTFTVAGGTLMFNTIDLMPHSSNPAKIAVTGSVNVNPLNNATATIANGSGSGTSGRIDLSGGSHSINVGDGSAEIDLAVNVPIINGALTKGGAGTMRLGAANTYSGVTTVNQGILQVTANSQLGSTGVVTGQSGTLQLTSNLSYGLPLAIGGAGASGVSLTQPGSVGSLDSLSGDNIWSGPITLTGTGSGGTDPLLNQIGTQAGSLRLSGIIQDGGIGATWAKTGSGDVILSGDSPNTYGGLTRLSGGRLIIEKDGALGAAGALDSANGNTFQLAGSASTVAFRAPTGFGGFNYNTVEVINTQGTGAPGFGQVDNLSGDNTFAGQIAFDGPDIGGARQVSIGVTSGSLHVSGGLYARGNDGTPRHITKLGAGTLILSGDGAADTGNPLVVPLASSTFNINAGAVELHAPSDTTTNLPGVATWNVNNGGTLNAVSGRFSTNMVKVNSGGQFNLTDGSAAISVLDLSGGGSFDFSGGKLHVDYVEGSLVNQAGMLASGTSPGVIEINGHYVQQAGAALEIEIGGPNAISDHDYLIAFGTATLGGMLDVSLLNDFVPTGGQQFTILSANSVVDDGLTLGGAAASLFNLLVGPTSVILEAISFATPGDHNGDGVVDAADYVTWRKNQDAYGGPAGYDDWRSNFGQPGGGASGTAASGSVPEPAAIALLAIAWAGLGFARGRRPRQSA